MKLPFHKSILALACVAAFPVCSQTVTTPPRAISSQQETPGVDSTFQGNVQPNAVNSTLTLAIPAAPTPAPAPAPAPPPVTCTASSSSVPVTQTASCPVGYLTTSGTSTFTQTATQTTTTSCPSGPYGAPSTSTSTGAWSPTPAAACTVLIPNILPINGQTFVNEIGIPVISGGGHPSGQAELTIEAWNGGWQIYKTGWGEAMTVLASGGLPSGAVSVAYSIGAITQSGDKPVTSNNGATSPTTLTASGLYADLQSAVVRGSTSDISEGTATITVYFYNSAGAVVAKATFTFTVASSGTA